MNWEITFCQQIGSNRKQNQDALFNGERVYQYNLKKSETFYSENEDIILGIADGISSSPKPQLTSRFVMEKLAHCTDFTSAWLRNVQFQLCEQFASQHLGSSTTFVGVKLSKSGKMKVVNVGDSRAYKITSNNEWLQLSFDHTVLAEMQQQGLSNPAKHYANLYRCLSDCLIADYESRDFRIFCREFQLEKGESILLCYDGLSDYISDKIRKAIWQKYDNNRDRLTICRKMVKKYKSYDDFSAIIAKII